MSTSDDEFLDDEFSNDDLTLALVAFAAFCQDDGLSQDAIDSAWSMKTAKVLRRWVAVARAVNARVMHEMLQRAKQ